MKVVTLVICVLTLLVAEAAALRYHKRVGIPTAEAIRRQESSMRIAGGVQSYRGEHPFFAGLLITLKEDDMLSVCGGALVSNQYVVTIGQCWYDGESEGKTMEVVLGANALFSGGIRNYANWTMLHPEYDPDNLVNDIALVRIPNVASNSPGYNASSTLRDAYVKVMRNADCVPYYGTTVKYFSDFMCTSGTKRKGACRGDYGGPLILRRYSAGQDLLVGLVSVTSPAGCNSGEPTGYTRISSYVRWLNKYV